MRVLHVLNHLTYGGIEIMLWKAIPHLQEKGIESHFCCMAPESHLDEEITSLGCRIHRIKKSANPYQTAKQLQKLLKTNSYDLVHSHFGYTSGGVALGASRKKIPFLNSFHASAPTALESWENHSSLRFIKHTWLKLHRHLMEKHVTLHIGHSKANLDAFQPNWQTSQRYRLIPNGVHFQERKKQEKGSELRILHIGSFRLAKNHSELLQIFAEIQKREPKARLICVGDGPELTQIKKQTELLALSDFVSFEGVQHDPWKYYANADLLLFPSKSEGFANVLVEAQAAHLPIAASDLPAHRESVAPTQQHALFPLGDPQRAAEIALEQACFPQKLSDAKEHVCSRFSIEQFSKNLAALYLEV